MLSWIGDRSYSIYLLHMPLLYLAKYSDLTYVANFSNRAIQSLLAIALTFWLGHLNYSKVEQRFRGYRSEVSRNKFLKIGFATCFVPLSLSIVLLQSYNSDYFGLDRNLAVPAFAGDSQLECVPAESTSPCILNSNSSAPRILLLGDSHAAQYNRVFVNVAESLNVEPVFGTLSGCRVQYSNGPGDGYPPSCIQHNLSLLEWVIDNQPETIVVSQYIKSNDDQELLTDALSKLQKNTQNLVLIANNPVFPDGRFYMRGRPLLDQLLRGPYKPPGSFSSSQMDTSHLDASRSIVAWARINSIQTMDITEVICPSGLCVRRLNDKWLYKDSDHLSIYGASLTLKSWLATLSQLQLNK